MNIKALHLFLCDVRVFLCGAIFHLDLLSMDVMRDNRELHILTSMKILFIINIDEKMHLFS